VCILPSCSCSPDGLFWFCPDTLYSTTLYPLCVHIYLFSLRVCILPSCSCSLDGLFWFCPDTLYSTRFILCVCTYISFRFVCVYSLHVPVRRMDSFGFVRIRYITPASSFVCAHIYLFASCVYTPFTFPFAGYTLYIAF
jgi:hypothetical protein